MLRCSIYDYWSVYSRVVINIGCNRLRCRSDLGKNVVVEVLEKDESCEVRISGHDHQVHYQRLLASLHMFILVVHDFVFVCGFVVWRKLLNCSLSVVRVFMRRPVVGRLKTCVSHNYVGVPVIVHMCSCVHFTVFCGTWSADK